MIFLLAIVAVLAVVAVGSVKAVIDGQNNVVNHILRVPYINMSSLEFLGPISNMSTLRFAHSPLANPMRDCMTGSDIVTFVKLIEASKDRAAFCNTFLYSTVGQSMTLGITQCLTKNRGLLMYPNQSFEELCNTSSTLNSSMTSTCIKGLSQEGRSGFAQNEVSLMFTCLRIVVYTSGAEIPFHLFPEAVVAPSKDLHALIALSNGVEHPNNTEDPCRELHQQIEEILQRCSNDAERWSNDLERLHQQLSQNLPMHIKAMVSDFANRYKEKLILEGLAMWTS
jgi:hypothetical protein